MLRIFLLLMLTSVNLLATEWLYRGERFAVVDDTSILIGGEQVSFNQVITIDHHTIYVFDSGYLVITYLGNGFSMLRMGDTRIIIEVKDA